MIFVTETWVDDLAHQAATSPNNDLPQPTEAQKRAGIYKKGHLKIHGLNISIENPKHSVRSGIDHEGKPWKSVLAHHYGYLRGTVGRDKDHIDCFIGEDLETDKVFIINQKNHMGKFDEHKIMICFPDHTSAIQGYLKNYAPGWEDKGLGSVHGTTVGGLKGWIRNGKTTCPYKGL